ncbi:MAG: hypothetical protein QM582_03375, partial [Micropruina sp.]|uniref:hypothetical protein n=1 Tax=Micropruina sp. TaxID=2737536 RepID=UPI0039E57EC7
MPKSLARTSARLARTAVLVLLALVVVAAGALLAVPQWRTAVLSPSVLSSTAPPPAGYRPPATAAAPELPLEALTPTPAPSAKA